MCRQGRCRTSNQITAKACENIRSGRIFGCLLSLVVGEDVTRWRSKCRDHTQVWWATRRSQFHRQGLGRLQELKLWEPVTGKCPPRTHWTVDRVDVLSCSGLRGTPTREAIDSLCRKEKNFAVRRWFADREGAHMKTLCVRLTLEGALSGG